MGSNSFKLIVARAQLGTALALFIRDRDALSVQALACGGCEIIEGMASEAKLPTLSSHILENYPEMTPRKLRATRNQYWNAIKHFYTPDHKSPRQDDALLADFKDTANDGPLFNGWLDYQQVTKKLPLEAQVFQVWWYALNENRLKPGSDTKPFRDMFPDIEAATRREQKRQLRRAIEKYRKSREILADERTELGPLIAHIL